MVEGTVELWFKTPLLSCACARSGHYRHRTSRLPVARLAMPALSVLKVLRKPASRPGVVLAVRWWPVVGGYAIRKCLAVKPDEAPPSWCAWPSPPVADRRRVAPAAAGCCGNRCVGHRAEHRR